MRSNEIQLLAARDVDAYVAHRLRHDPESGTEGDLPYGPYDRAQPQDPGELRERALLSWLRPVDETGWRRVWGLWSGGAIVGSVHLHGATLPASLHRADLGIGLERPHRGRGQGRRLLEAAIAWARAEPTLDWIDLGVFAGNDRAEALYRSLGFVELGRTPDQFRVDGRSIVDIRMALRLRPART